MSAASDAEDAAAVAAIEDEDRRDAERARRLADHEARLTRTRRLTDYALELDQAIEVELLSVGGVGYVEGIVTGATDGVLLLGAGPARRTVRVPWRAIASIRNAPTAHPGI